MPILLLVLMTLPLIFVTSFKVMLFLSLSRKWKRLTPMVWLFGNSIFRTINSQQRISSLILSKLIIPVSYILYNYYLVFFDSLQYLSFSFVPHYGGSANLSQPNMVKSTVTIVNWPFQSPSNSLRVWSKIHSSVNVSFIVSFFNLYFFYWFRYF